MTAERDCGLQPLAAVMMRLNITADELVLASTQQLTFKMLNKGCKGRRLTPNGQYKILAALHALYPQENLTLKDLFNY